MNSLSYKCSGIYFKNLNNFSDNYLFIFPECRSDSKILNNGITIDNKNINTNINTNIENEKILEENDEDNLFDNIEKLEIDEKNYKSLPKLEKTTVKFIIHQTMLPDIYELYCKSNNNIEKYSHASVPDIDTSNFIKSLFSSNYNTNEDISNKIKNNNAIYVECTYHKSFKKWVPYKKVDGCDNLNVINQIQIILDSL